jgi:prefoldin alpha subunit
MLVPMTSSLYVPGLLETNQKVLIDVGTGYFLEKSVSAAKDFFLRRANFLKEKIEELQSVAASSPRRRHHLVPRCVCAVRACVHVCVYFCSAWKDELGPATKSLR